MKVPHTVDTINKNWKYLGVSLAFLIAFFGVLFFRSHLLTFDLDVSCWVSTIQSGWATLIATTISYVFDTYILLIASLAVGGYLFYKNYRPQSLLLLVAMGGNAFFVALFKALVHSSRPIESLIVDFSYSFPSGHTAGSIVFCGLLTYFAWQHWKTTRPRTILTTLTVIIISVVGFDRLYLNVHWFSDVLGGCLLGLFCLTFAILIFKVLLNNEKFNNEKYHQKSDSKHRDNVVVRNFLNGLAFGVTETVPGVSGGTIAIILGFYKELIEAVNHFTENVKKYTKFLIPTALGTITGLVIFSFIMNYLLLNFSFPTMMFFIGLVVGIIPLIYIKVKDPKRWFKPKELALIITSFLTVLIVSNLKPSTIINPAEIISYIDAPFMLFIFLAGIIAAIALVVPGISGSFILLLLGIYPLITYSISSIGYLLTDITNIHLMGDIAKVLVPLTLGAIIGGLSMAKLIEKLLKNHHKTMYSIILGLLLGSVYALLNEPFIFQSGLSALIISTSITTFSVGGIISFNLGKKRFKL